MRAQDNQEQKEVGAAGSESTRRHMLLGGVAAAAAVAGAGLGWRRSKEGEGAQDAASQAFWNLNLQTPDGQPLALQSLAGKPLLVNFWATWCPPCVRELPMLSAFAQAHPQWQVLGIAIDQAPAVQKFLARQPVHFPVAMAGAGGTTLTRTLGNDNGGLPFTVLFGAGGNVNQRKIGELSADDLQQWLLSL